MNAKYLKQWWVLLVVFLFSYAVEARQPADAGRVSTVTVASLPAEAQRTLLLIKQGGPFPNGKDGVVFGNYEGRLPRQARGYYHEYTVRTPGVRSRGARRLIAGGQPMDAHEFYYTADHYASFQRIAE